jgi:hypothetical protein
MGIAGSFAAVLQNNGNSLMLNDAGAKRCIRRKLRNMAVRKCPGFFGM